MLDTSAPKITDTLRDANNAFVLARRDYLLDNLFISDHVRDEFDPFEAYQIWVTDGLGRRFISLQTSQWDHPNRIWMDKDLTVWVGSAGVGTGDIFMPTRYSGDDHWYIGDELQQVGISTLPPHTSWESQVGILENKHVDVFNVTEETMKLICERFSLPTREDFEGEDE